MTESAPLDPHDAQTKLRNMVLDFFYKQVRLGKSNAEILRKLQSTDMPPVSEMELNALRAKFKAMEQRYPEKLSKFREKLKVP
jgi:hypothetical protein